MTKRRKLSDLQLPPTDELVVAILRDQDWFSIFDLVALLSGDAGVRWRQEIRGVVTYDDWLDFVEEHGGAVLESLAGSVHAPDGRWEFPFAVTADEIILPDSATDEQEEEVEARLRSLHSAA